MYEDILGRNIAYPWRDVDGIKFRGYIINNNKIYKDYAAIDFIKSELNNITMEELLKVIDGLFSIILEDSEQIICAVDRMRSLPLFYATNNDDFFVSDKAENIYNILTNLEKNETSFEELTKTDRFISGNETLIKNINQVEAGGFICYKKDENHIVSNNYYSYSDIKVTEQSDEYIKKEFDRVFNNVALKNKAVINERTVIVPLTGGIDSREVLCLLNRVGYSKVICYTCGKKNSKEVKIAKKLAEYFNYEWIHCDYNKRKWKKFLYSKEADRYRIYCGNFVSTPHMLEIIGVKELVENNKIPKNSVFIPGHTGAIIGGKILPILKSKSESILNETIINEAKKSFYQGNKLSKDLESKFEKSIGEVSHMNKEEIQAIIHNFEMKERQSKFMCNSVRLYEYLGYEWLLPLCDIEFLEFMKNIPIKFKINKVLVKEYIGISNIESTADNSLYNQISNVIRKNSIAEKYIRKVSKIIKYFNDQLQITRGYGFIKYISTCIRSNEYFTINTIERNIYLELVRKMLNEKK